MVALCSALLCALLPATAAISLPSRQEVFQSYDARLRTDNNALRTSVLTLSLESSDLQLIVYDQANLQLIIGMSCETTRFRDALMRVRPADLALLQRVDWPADSAVVARCQLNGRAESECRNFIRTLAVTDERVLACGTNAFSPVCSWRHAADLQRRLGADLDGVGAAPYNPQSTSAYLLTSDGHLLSGLSIDFNGYDKAFLRIMPPNRILRTAKSNRRWLNEPLFVGAFEDGNFAYVVFRETALESDQCGSPAVSRIARVCKNDAGGDEILKDYWSTFTKSTLNCSTGGVSYPLIQSIAFDTKRHILFGVFTTERIDLAESAICAFDAESLRRAFGGAYLYQQSAGQTWIEQKNNYPYFDCEVEGALSARPGLTRRSLFEAQKYQLMATDVRPSVPAHVSALERYTHILVDAVRQSDHSIAHVLFIVTTDGLMKKFTFGQRGGQLCLVEVIQLFAPTNKQNVLSLVLLHEQRAIILGTKDELVKVAVERCERHKNERACTGAADPYCGWDVSRSRCSTAPNGVTSHRHWRQSAAACPTSSSALDGEYGAWTAWATCSREAERSCRCRTRLCDSPRPSYGGRDCDGESVQVANCTVDGGWTQWADWSACSATCGPAARQRRRQCGAPTWAYGGAPCEGDALQLETCSQPTCAAPTAAPVHGDWSAWSAWAHCSHRCGGGVQTRLRACNSPSPSAEGVLCAGCDMDSRSCNDQPCEEMRRWSQWTPWLQANATGNSGVRLLKRFKFACKARVSDPQLISLSAARVEEKFCMQSSNNCSSTGFDKSDGDWSAWGEWAACSKRCGSGSQSRRRTCTKPRQADAGRDCDGPAVESRQCQAHDCSASWSCWSDYSECSVSCGSGLQHRYRSCDTASSTHPCPGTRIETKSCHVGPCSNGGFGSWSGWSACSHLDVSVRVRPCLSTALCDNIPDAQMRRCFSSDPVERAVSSGTFARDRLAFALSLLASFSVGVSLTLLLSCWAVRRRSNCFFGYAKRSTVRVPPTSKAACNIYSPPPMRLHASIGTLRENRLAAQPLRPFDGSVAGDDGDTPTLTLQRAMRASLHPDDYL